MTRTGKCNLNLGYSELGRPKLSRTDWEYTLQNGRGRLVLVTSCHPDETLWPRQLEKSLFWLTVPEKVQKGRRVLVETTEQKAEKPHTEQHTESKEIELEMGRFQTVKARHQQRTFSSNAPPLKASIISPQRTNQGPSVQVCKTMGHISCLNHPGWSGSQEQSRMGEMMSAKTPGMKTVLALQTGTTHVFWRYVALPQTAWVTSMFLPSAGTYTSVGYPVATWPLCVRKYITNEGVMAPCFPHAVLRTLNGRR